MKVCQQSEVYAAERGVSRGRTFRSVNEIQTYVDALRDTQWWHSLGFWIVERVEVGPVAKRHTRSIGWYDREQNAGRIEMDEHDWYERAVLHELAHVLAMAQHDSHAHDPAFARTYLTLVYCLIGHTVYTELAHQLDRHGVNYDFPLVPESKFAL